MLRSRILGTGSYLPKRIVTNTDLEKMMDTSTEWIEQRTGIRERRFVEEGEGTADLGFQASLRALEAAQVHPDEIDFIIFATLTPDYTFPGSGCLLQEKLRIKPIGALDVRNQCSGFIYGLSVADQYIRTGTYSRILLVGAEVQSTGLELNTHGRDMGVLFGDGAGAVLLGPAGEARGICFLPIFMRMGDTPRNSGSRLLHPFAIQEFPSKCSKKDVITRKWMAALCSRQPSNVFRKSSMKRYPPTISS